MKIKVITLAMLFVLSTGLTAQKNKVSRYETFVYTNEKIEALIQNEQMKQERSSRGFLEDLGGAFLNAGKGVAGGYVTSIIDIGVNTIAGLITQGANNKIKWEEIVKAENSYQETLTTTEPINNFYSKPSFDGAMDPAGMNFDGIGCLRTINGDTAFYISCHVNPAKIDRIINHSKFELSLDTLIIDPYQCDLPNSNLDLKFSFEYRKNLQIIVEMRLISSWINEFTELQKNQELGNFTISVPVSQADLDAQGKLRYVKTANIPEKFKITGESFIIPRSYMGFRDKENNYKNSWGTGDYRVELSIKETCGITDAYRKNWKADWKVRQDAENDENFIQKSWKTITSQRWDELGKQWVITTLKAPADMVNSELLKELNLPVATATQPKAGGGGTKK